MMRSCEHDHSNEDQPSRHGLEAHLSDAEVRLHKVGEKLSPSRRRVLELLLESGQPSKAYDLMAAFQLGAPAKPPTVYRALEFLERQGLVHRIQSLNAYVACNRQGVHTAAFLICDCCGETAETELSLEAAIATQVAKTGFIVNGVTVEARGRCARCSQDLAKK